MLRAITDIKRVAEIHRTYVEIMRRHLGQSAPLKIGFKGEVRDMTAHHKGELWFTSQPSQNNNRYWDAYGLEPSKTRSNNITVEINVPVEGINRTISALYAEDSDTKEIFLLHRGKVGGGRPGIGKDAFTAWYSGGIAAVDELDGRTTQVFLITSLGDPHMADNVASFVKAVSVFKSTVTSAQQRDVRGNGNNNMAHDFHDEFSGKKDIPARASTTADCNHGRVVTSLKRHLEAQHKGTSHRLINTKKIDLALMEASQLLHVWEVKTDISLQNLYTGIGQLIVNTMGQSMCHKTLVLPDAPPLPNPFLVGLKDLGISVILYNMGHEIKFS